MFVIVNFVNQLYLNVELKNIKIHKSFSIRGSRLRKEKVMDWTTFIGVVIVLLLAVIPMMVFPKASETIITDINSAISNSIGSVYLFLGLAIFVSFYT